MANKTASKKDIRQSEKRRIRNKSVKSSIKTYTKNVETAIASAKKDDALAALKQFEKNSMRAVSKGIFNIKTVARKISRLYSRIKNIA